METKDIRLALEHLQMLAERSYAEDWPSAIERDLMLAELRKIYDALLFAAPQKTTVEPAPEIADTAVAAVGVTMVQNVVEESDAELSDMEPLDLEDAFEDSSADKTEEAAEMSELAAEPDVSEETETDETTLPEKPLRTEDSVRQDERAVVQTQVAEQVEDLPEPDDKNLLFDLGTIQHRSHRRMMSLYDDETFDRLPEKSASAEAVQTPVYQNVEDESESAPLYESEPQPEPESEPVFEPQPAPEYRSDEPVAEFVPESESAVGSAAPEEIVTRVSEEEENLQELEPEPEHTPVVLGDVMNSGVEVLGDTMAPQESLGDTLAHAPVTGGLMSALDLSERYQIIAELFGGDADACDAAMDRLDEMDTLEEAVIYIEENFRWNSSSPATTLMMDLLDRKFN